MTILALLIALLITAVIVWLCQQGTIPAPFQWIAYAVLLILWFIALLQILGFGNLGMRVG